MLEKLKSKLAGAAIGLSLTGAIEASRAEKPLAEKPSADFINGDTVRVTARDVVDTFQSEVFFDGQPEMPISRTNFKTRLTVINEKCFFYQCPKEGLEVINGKGNKEKLKGWSGDGFVVEFCVSSADNGFPSFTPANKGFFIEVSDIDIARKGKPDLVPTGFYISFTRGGEPVKINWNSKVAFNEITIDGLPIAMGACPQEEGQKANHKALYLTLDGTKGLGRPFAFVKDNKLTVTVDGENGLGGISLKEIVENFGMTKNVDQAPQITEFKFGVRLQEEKR